MGRVQKSREKRDLQIKLLTAIIVLASAIIKLITGLIDWLKQGGKWGESPPTFPVIIA